MDSRPIPIGVETNQIFSRQDFLNIPRNPNSQREAGIEDNQQKALVLIDEIGQILNKDKIGRDDINAINRKYQKIDAMERHEYTSVEASSVRVLTVLIRKVKLIAIAEGSISAQGLVSLFFLSKFNDFPQITTIFNETVAKLNSLNQKRIKALDRRIVQVIPHCESEMQFNKDMVELLKTVDPSLSNSEIDELIKKRIQLFREMSSRQEEQRKTEEAFHARRRILGEGVSNVFSKKSSLEGEKRLAPEAGPEPDFQPEPNSSVLAELEQEIQLKPELQSAIEQARKMKEQQNNNDILVFLGTTQVGKSSTLNFLSGQTPFIERGFVHVSDFEIQNDLFEFSLDKEDAFLIINYLVDQKLLRWIKERDFYIPTFRNGARILATEENMEKEALKDFISRKFPNKDLNEIYNFVIRQLTAKTEKLEKSSKGHPSIGYRNPIFTYGFGLFSTTIIAQVKQQDWNVTTVDLPGTGEIKGKEYSLVSAYSTFTSLNNTQTVRGAVILLAYDQLAGGSTTAASMIQVLKSADNILGNAIDMDNICILVTKIPLVVTEIEFTGEEKKRQLSEDEIYNDIENKLFKFYQILTCNTSIENQRLTSILKKVIDNRQFMPVTPMRTMEEFTESALASNVNLENRDKITGMLSRLRPVKVTEGYFLRTYSSLNGNISEVIGDIQDEVLKISSLLNNHRNELKKLFDDLERKHRIIQISVNVAAEYLKSMRKELEFEQMCFQHAVEEYVQQSQGAGKWFAPKPPRQRREFYSDKKRMQRVDEIKKLAIIRAKQKVIDLPSLDEVEYQPKIQRDIAQLEIIIKETEGKIQRVKSNIEKSKKTLQDPENKRNEESYNVEKVTRNEYWYKGDQTGKIRRPHSHYPMRCGFTISENVGKFKVVISDFDSKDNTWTYRIIATKKAGLFTSYKLTAQLHLSWKSEDRLNYEIEQQELELADLEAEHSGELDRLNNFKELEQRDRKLYEIDQELKQNLVNQKKEYLDNLNDLQQNIRIQGDRTQIMSITDIRKVMIGTITSNCDKDFAEVQKVQAEIDQFFDNPKTKENMKNVKRGISSYKNLIDMLEINLFDNDKRFDASIKFMTIEEMQRTFAEIGDYDKKFAHIMSLIQRHQIEMESIRSEIDGLRLNIDELDAKIMNYIEVEDHRWCSIS